MLYEYAKNNANNIICIMILDYYYILYLFIIYIIKLFNTKFHFFAVPSIYDNI
jgi:hypothetical protein